MLNKLSHEGLFIFDPFRFRLLVSFYFITCSKHLLFYNAKALELRKVFELSCRFNFCLGAQFRFIIGGRPEEPVCVFV